MEGSTEKKISVLHICSRETLRPLRDQILRISGFEVESTLAHAECLSMSQVRNYDLVLIDVEGESGIRAAEQLCSQIRESRNDQIIAFVCNWRVAFLTDCPDEIVRTEFDPAGFVRGVRDAVENHSVLDSRLRK